MHFERKVSFLLIAVISVVFNLITLLSFLDNRNTVHQEIESADLDSLTGAQLLDYFLWTNRSSCGLIHDFGGVLLTALDGRFRAFDGQKAVCLDKKIAPHPNNCLIYSFGINYEWSFDEEMEAYGCRVYSFDHTMETDEERFNHSSGISFYRLGLSDKDDSSQRLKSLTFFYKMHSKCTSWRYSYRLPEDGHRVLQVE